MARYDDRKKEAAPGRTSFPRVSSEDRDTGDILAMQRHVLSDLFGLKKTVFCCCGEMHRSYYNKMVQWVQGLILCRDAGRSG